MPDEIYVSTDVEADGPIPGPNSMLSFASAAFLADKTPVGTFAANLTTLPGAAGDPKTMAWWQSQPEAWAACRSDQRDPAVVMPEYVAWLKALPGKPVFVAYPAAYDFMFVYWYLIRFAGERINFVPGGGASEASGRQYCTTVDGSIVPWMISSHAITVLPWRWTMAWARSMKAEYCSGVIFFTSSPPMWMYGPGVMAASSRITSSRNLNVISFSKQKLLKPTSIPV